MILYRISDASCVEYSPRLEEWVVVRETPKTYLVEQWGRRHRVLKGAHKQFACLTREAALISYRARKERQLRILRGQLRRTEARLSWAKGADPLNLVQRRITYEPLTLIG